jgi:hypothetical protein
MLNNMKYLIIFLSLTVLFGCSGNKGTGNTAIEDTTALQPDSVSQEVTTIAADNPPGEQSPQNVLDYLKNFPVDRIQEVEEWSNATKLELAEKGKAGDWKIRKADTTAGLIEVTVGEIGDMGFNFGLYKKKNGDAVVGVIQFSGQALYDVHFYKYNAQSNQWSDANELLPKLNTSMYLREDFDLSNNKEAADKAPGIYMYKDTLKTAISTWILAKDYELELDEDKDVKYDIDLLWDGEKFVLDKKESK